MRSKTNPSRMGRGAGSAFGLEPILGFTARNSTKSVRNSDWSAMLAKVEKTFWMLLLVPAIAPARNCRLPGERAGNCPIDDIGVGAIVPGGAEQR